MNRRNSRIDTQTKTISPRKLLSPGSNGLFNVTMELI